MRNRSTIWLVKGVKLLRDHPKLWMLGLLWMLSGIGDWLFQPPSLIWFFAGFIMAAFITVISFSVLLRLLRVGRVEWQLPQGIGRFTLQTVSANALLVLFGGVVASLIAVIIVILARTVFRLHDLPTGPLLFFGVAIVWFFIMLYFFVPPLIIDRRLKFWPAMEASRKKVQQDLPEFLYLAFILAGITAPAVLAHHLLTRPFSTIFSFLWGSAFAVFATCVTAVAYRELWPDKGDTEREARPDIV